MRTKKKVDVDPDPAIEKLAEVTSGGTPLTDGKVKCEECGHRAHLLVTHIREHGLSIEEYAEKHPDAPVFSSAGFEVLHKQVEKTRKRNRGAVATDPERAFELVTIEDVFGWPREQGLVKRYLDTTPFVPAGDDEGFHYDYAGTLMVLLGLHRPKRNSVWIGGESGVGKTQLILNIARRLRWEVFRVNGDVSITREDLVGGLTVLDRETVFQYGVIPLAMKRGALLLLDEGDQLNPHVLPLFRPLFEDNPRLLLLENGGEVVTPAEGFRLAVTANTFGNGDASGHYSTTHMLSLADRQRVGMFVKLDFLAPEAEQKLLLDNVTDLEPVEAVRFIQVANAIRMARKAGEIEEAISPRQLINWSELYVETGSADAIRAAEMSFLLPLGDGSQASIKQLIEASGLPHLQKG